MFTLRLGYMRFCVKTQAEIFRHGCVEGFVCVIALCVREKVRPTRQGIETHDRGWFPVLRRSCRIGRFAYHTHKQDTARVNECQGFGLISRKLHKTCDHGVCEDIVKREIFLCGLSRRLSRTCA